MKIKDKECLPVIQCDVNGDGLLHLDKAASMRLINGTPISSGDVMAEFGYLDFSYTIPLKLVPLLWGLKLLQQFRKRGFLNRSRWYHRQWDKIGVYQDPIKRVNSGITYFKIGVVKRE